MSLLNSYVETCITDLQNKEVYRAKDQVSTGFNAVQSSWRTFLSAIYVMFAPVHTILREL
jgi:hypothetical protein